MRCRVKKTKENRRIKFLIEERVSIKTHALFFAEIVRMLTSQTNNQ